MKETKPQFTLGLFLFSIILNTMFATLVLVRVSLDAWGLAQIATAQTTDDRAGRLYYLWSAFYIAQSSRSILTSLLMLICLVLVLLLPLMYCDAVNSFRKRAPLARNVADVIAAVMLSSILFIGIFVSRPTEKRFAAECAEVSNVNGKSCYGLGVKLLTIHTLMLCMEIAMLANAIVKFNANKAFDVFDVLPQDSESQCDVNPNPLGKGVAHEDSQSGDGHDAPDRSLRTLLEDRHQAARGGDKFV